MRLRPSSPYLFRLSTMSARQAGIPRSEKLTRCPCPSAGRILAFENKGYEVPNDIEVTLMGSYRVSSLVVASHVASTPVAPDLPASSSLHFLDSATSPPSPLPLLLLQPKADRSGIPASP